ncbi:MAG: outer membrane beta-barrel protein [Hyphomicrobium sp.]|jgi:hypothetical protein
MGAHLAGSRTIGGFWRGFAAVAGVGTALACALLGTPAAAQIIDPPGWRAEVRRPPPRLRPSLPDESLLPLSDADRQAFESETQDPDQRLRASLTSGDGISAPEDGAAEAEVEAEAMAGGEVADDEGPRRRAIAMRQDGDPIPTLDESAAGADGVNDMGASIALLEGEEDITEADMRSAQDVRAFAAEPAGYDPLLLQADETNPVFSPSTFEGFAFDPYPPIGTKIGSFLLFTTLEANYDFNNNLFASPFPVGDSSLEVRPAARLASNWGRHALEFRASGDLSYHDRYSSEDNRAYLVEGLGRVDVTSRTNLQGLISHEFAQESRSAINAESAGTRPNIEVTRLRGAFNQRFNRLSVQLRGNIVDTSYSPNIFDNQVQNNSDRDYKLYEQAVRPRWEFSPYLFAFSDISLNQRDYSIAAYSDGILRSSTGERYRFGLSFGDVSQILRGNISLGYAHQELDNHELPAVDGMLIDADLAWLVSPLTVLQFTATSDIAETTTAGSPGVMERNYGFEARHSFTRYLVGSAGVGYMTRNFVGTDINEEQFTAAVGSEYYLNPWAVLFARYEHTDFQSSLPESSYTVEEVQAGVRLRH